MNNSDTKSAIPSSDIALLMVAQTARLPVHPRISLGHNVIEVRPEHRLVVALGLLNHVARGGLLALIDLVYGDRVFWNVDAQLLAAQRDGRALDRPGRNDHAGRLVLPRAPVGRGDDLLIALRLRGLAGDVESYQCQRQDGEQREKPFFHRNLPFRVLPTVVGVMGHAHCWVSPFICKMYWPRARKNQFVIRGLSLIG